MSRDVNSSGRLRDIGDRTLGSSNALLSAGNPASSRLDNDIISSLMGSLNADLGSPMKRNIIPRSDTSSASSSSSRDDFNSGMRPSALVKKNYIPPQSHLNDEVDFTVIKFGTECLLRGNIGRYITAIPNEDLPENGSRISFNISVNPSDNPGAGNSHHNIATSTAAKSLNSTIYALGVKGMGVSEPLDCVSFVNVEQREDQGNIRYGMAVAIRAPAAKERLLGIRESSKLGFFRNLIGQGEKWIILKGHMGSSSVQRTQGVEDIDARGTYVRIGDLILLQTASSDQLLSVYEGAGGAEGRLVPKGAGALGLGGEVWQLELFCAQPIPPWMNRPYLSGKFLVMTPGDRSLPPETEARTFPNAAVGRNHSASAGSAAPPVPPLNSFSSTVQHLILMRELLLAFAGIEGQYIRLAQAAPGSAVSSSNSAKPKLKDVTLLIDLDTAERSAANQVSSLLPICENAIRIREFIKFHARYEFGLVSHAIVSVIKVILREFDILTAQLEHLLITNKLTLQKTTYLLQPAKSTLGSLVVLTRRLRDFAGGQLIDKLYTGLLDQGDSKTRELYSHILEKASDPFLGMLAQWVFRGELNDPYKEFMIQEDSSITREALQEDFNAQYWESRFRLRDSHVPKIFKDLAFRALVAGKYLNVIRGCVEYLTSQGQDSSINNGGADEEQKDNQLWYHQLVLPVYTELKLDLNSGLSTIKKSIDEAYALSSRALLKLLQEGHGITSHIRSLRRFLLLEHGDFFIQFMDTADEELRRDVKDIKLSRVQNLLHLAVQTSTLSIDLNREDISCSLASHNLIQHLHLIQSAGENTTDSYLSSISQGLKGVEALTMDYKVGWPASIVLSRRAITKYQLLSRLLYFSKHVERRVLSCWQDHQGTKNLNVRGALGTAYCLRHRMLHFLQNFVYYMTVEVISPRSHELSLGMAEAQDVDEVLVLHERFLDTCLKECLLASQDLLKILTKLMTTCLLFADNLKKFASDSEIVDAAVVQNSYGSNTTANRAPASAVGGGAGSASVAAVLARRKIAQNARKDTRTEYIQRETSHEWFHKMLSKFTQTFDSQLKEFLDKLWGESYRQHPQLSNLCVRIDYNGYYSGNFNPNSH